MWGWLYVCAQRTNVQVFQGPAAELTQAEAISEAPGGPPAQADPRDRQPSRLPRHPEKASPSAPRSAERCQRRLAPLQWLRSLLLNWFPVARRHCRRSLRLTTSDCYSTMIHFLPCMLYLSVFTLDSSATASIEHRQLYPKEGDEGKGRGEVYVALGNVGAKCETSAK